MKPTWMQHIGKSVAVLASTGAALVSIITALFSYGFLGNSESHQSIGNFGAAWVRLNPTVDTAYAIGDTIRFAATVADKNGSILVGAHPTWTTGDSSVATVSEDGAVIAQGPGATAISVVVGKFVSQAHIMVRPRVAGVILSTSLGDTALTLGEGRTLALHARPVDARGHGITRATTAGWHVDDSTVAILDPQGVLTGLTPGRTVVSATIDGVSSYLPVAIVSVASALDVVSGGNQRATVGHALTQPVVVRATTRRGAPAVGKVVRFRIANGQIGDVTDSVVTDADGRARASWTLGTLPGRQAVLATVENVDSAVTIVAEADPDAANTRVMPIVEALHARAGDILTDSVGVRVTDSVGRALPDVPVRWVALQGSAEAVTARTDSMGVAKARWTLAKETGLQKLRAYVGGASGALGIPPISITSSAAAGSAADIVTLDGDNQRGTVGAELRKPIRLRVLDGNGNGVASTQVVLSLSGGSVADSLVSTDSLGMVRVPWAMGRSAGEYTLAAHVDGVKKLLKLTARAAPAVAANLSFDDVPDKNARPQARRLVAVVTDEYGNPVPDAAVTMSVQKGMVTPARAITDAKGRVEVRWMLSGTGEQTLKGSVRGTDVRGSYVMAPAAPKTTTTTTKSAPKKRV